MRGLDLLLLVVLLTLAGCCTVTWVAVHETSSRSTHPDDTGDGISTRVPFTTMDEFTATGGRYDGKASWAIEGGTLIGREGPDHAGGLLYTKERYEHAQVTCEVRIDYPFDSGIFFRMGKDGKGPQVTLDDRPGGEIGGIYADGWWRHTPAGIDAWKKNAWNRVRARCVGHPAHIQVWINDTLVCDHRLPQDAGGFAREGMIGFQVHGGEGTAPEQAIRFRNIEVERISPSPEFQTYDEGRVARTHYGEAAGWKDLLESGLEGWTAAGKGTGYRVRDGVLELLHEGASPHLLTNDDYEDFHLVLDFQIQDMANSGIFLRADREKGNPAFSGREVQILDDHNWETATKSTLKDWQFTGSLYGAVAPARKVLRPNGEWNHLEIICDGSRQITTLNGVVLYDVDTHTLEVKPPFAERAKTGFIGIQRHAPATKTDDDVYARFRNIFVRRLP